MVRVQPQPVCVAHLRQAGVRVARLAVRRMAGAVVQGQFTVQAALVGLQGHLVQVAVAVVGSAGKAGMVLTAQAAAAVAVVFLLERFLPAV